MSVPFPHPTILPKAPSVWRACNACDILFVCAGDFTCPSCHSFDTKPSLGPLTFHDTPETEVVPAPTAPTAPTFPKVSGTRLCLSCGFIYSVSYTLNLGHSYATCPNCQSKNTALPPPSVWPPVPDAPPSPRQMAFFTIPPIPHPIAWRIDSRWRKKMTKGMMSRWNYRSPEYRPEDQTWTVYSKYNVTSKKAADSRIRLYRASNPFRQFRAVPVTWSLTPLINPFP